ncbi:MAG: hypothetical protein RR585_16015, partial [Coprobacillus sp.]
NYMKKYLKLVLISLMAFGIWGCSDQSSNGSSDSKKETPMINEDVLISNFNQFCEAAYNGTSVEKFVSPLSGDYDAKDLVQERISIQTGEIIFRTEKIIVLGWNMQYYDRPNPCTFLFDKDGLLIMNKHKLINDNILTQQELQRITSAEEEYRDRFPH